MVRVVVAGYHLSHLLNLRALIPLPISIPVAAAIPNILPVVTHAGCSVFDEAVWRYKVLYFLLVRHRRDDPPRPRLIKVRNLRDIVTYPLKVPRVQVVTHACIAAASCGPRPEVEGCVLVKINWRYQFGSIVWRLVLLRVLLGGDVEAAGGDEGGAVVVVVVVLVVEHLGVWGV